MCEGEIEREGRRRRRRQMSYKPSLSGFVSTKKICIRLIIVEEGQGLSRSVAKASCMDTS